jgi:RNA recognition motif-containing protein
MSIYVGNVSFKATEADIKQLFSDYGHVKLTKMIHDRETDRFKGFCFLEMSADSEEAEAINALNGKEFMGRQLNVSKARS